jgi:phage gp46-like protein
MEFDRDQTTGDYIEDAQGRPQMTTSLGPAVRARLRAHRTQWLHAPDDQWGSDFYRYRKRRSVDFSDSLGESIAQKALEPLEKDGRIDNLEVVTQFTQRGGVAFAASFLDRQKQQGDSVTTPIGVP